MNSTWLTALAFAIYLAAAVCYGAFLFLRAPSAPTALPDANVPMSVARFGRPLLLAALAIHFLAIGAHCMATRRSPFASEFGTLSVAAWIIALVFAAFDLRVRLPAVGAVALLLASLLLSWGLAHARGPVAPTPALKGHLVTLHVLAILASFALFVLAFGCAMLYLVQNRLLKERNIKGLFRRLPPLETLDSVAYHAVAVALPLLTVGLALGILRAIEGGVSGSPQRSWLLDAHTLASIGTWFLYVVYLAARLLTGWRGVRLQYILIAGLFVALALYFVPSSMHQFF
jgi:ABC-type transport system involved in cytochrome c biogenesis permease subunit